MSKYTDDLDQAAAILRAAGYPVSAAACENGAKRMKAMEDLIVSLKDEVHKLDEN